MKEEDALVALLQFYKKLETVTRPEFGTLTGKRVGQIAGTCNRHNIKPWPEISKKVLIERGCQFPIKKNGERYICGTFRTDDPLVCHEHKTHIWDPAKEK